MPAFLERSRRGALPAISPPTRRGQTSSITPANVAYNIHERGKSPHALPSWSTTISTESTTAPEYYPHEPLTDETAPNEPLSAEPLTAETAPNETLSAETLSETPPAETPPAETPPVAAIAPAAWYRRRTTKVIGATAVAGALVLGGAFAYSHAPEYAVAKAMDNVGTLPVGGTLTIDEKGSPEFTFGATQDAFSFGATYQDSTVELVTTEDVAAFRVQLGGEDRPSESDLAMLDSMAPGLDQVLSGRWVSVDVSGDSALAKELARTGAKTEPDPEVQAAV